MTNKNVLFYSVIGMLIVYNILAIVISFPRALVEDGSYNLSVAKNIVDLGTYSSSGVLTTGTGEDLFDYRITTGPTVILPTAFLYWLGIDIIIASKITIMIYYIAMLIGLSMLGKQLSGRIGVIVGLTIPSVFAGYTTVNNFNILDYLGEIPSILFLTLSLIVFIKRPGWSALFFSLAILTKIALLSVLIVFVGYFFIKRQPKSGVLFGLISVSTVALFELVKLVYLQPDGYKSYLLNFIAFFNTAMGGFRPYEKMYKLLDVWAFPPIILCVIISFILLYLFKKSNMKNLKDVFVHFSKLFHSANPLYVISSAAFMLSISLWLISDKDDIWIRTITPALLTYFTVICIGIISTIYDKHVKKDNTATYILAVLGLLIPIQLIIQLFNISIPPIEKFGTLEEQRMLSLKVQELNPDYIVGIWGDSPFQAVVNLTGIDNALLWKESVDFNNVKDKDIPEHAHIYYVGYKIVQIYDIKTDYCSSEIFYEDNRYVICATDLKTIRNVEPPI